MENKEKSLLQQLSEFYDRRVGEFSKTGKDYLKSQGYTQEQANMLSPLNLDPVGIVGGIKKVSPGLSKLSSYLKGAPVAEEAAQVIEKTEMTPVTQSAEELKEALESFKKYSSESAPNAVIEELVNPDPKLEAINRIISKKPTILKQPTPAAVETLSELTAKNKRPLAESSSIAEKLGKLNY